MLVQNIYICSRHFSRHKTRVLIQEDMKYNFIIKKRKRKDGRHNVEIKVQHSREFQKIITTDINVFPDHFTKKKGIFRCKNTHPESAEMNRKIRVWKNRCEEAYDKFLAGAYSFNRVCDHIANKLQGGSIDEYVETYIKKYKTNATYIDIRGKIGIIKSHMKIKGKLRWEVIDRDWWDELLLTLERATNKQGNPLSNTSIKSYAIAIQSVLNDAKERGVIREYVALPKKLKTGGKKRRKKVNERLKTTSYMDLIDYIDEMPLRLEVWQDFALWHLCFCLRGMYPADIVKMTSEELDKPTFKKYFDNELHIEHLRSKTEHTDNTHMYIHVDNQIVLPLILALKRVALYKWNAKYKDKLADPMDMLKIYDYNPTEEKQWHSNRWQLHTRRLRKYGMSLLSARKSFETFAEEIEMGDKETPVEFNELARLILLGRAHDPILSKSYSNIHGRNMRQIINKAHKYVLEQYQAPLITTKLITKLMEIVSKNAPRMPYWIAIQPQATINGLYEKIIEPSDKNEQIRKKYKKGVELCNNFDLQLIGLGRKTDKGYYHIYRRDNEPEKATIFKITSEYQWYWRKYVGRNMFEVEDMDELLAHMDKKIKEKTEKYERKKAEQMLERLKDGKGYNPNETSDGKVIQLPPRADKHLTAEVYQLKNLN